jgi:phage shock protein C
LKGKVKKMSVKKLYKSSKERVICGVCGGIAEYLKVDASLIRVLWVLFACLGGSGILAYIIIAIILPEKTKIEVVNEENQDK